MEDNCPTLCGKSNHWKSWIEMAKTLLKYDKYPEMRKLAETIIKAQQLKIDQMQT
ncbi:hypothetical protein DPS92_23655 [Salmonella enterica subsp. enterica serovar Richmond]|uniref:DUF305 domain-containing protein n=1 Tax=Salmonella enterica TaxID=28901 RepID=UPI000E1BA76C|nr:hypothetical protein [Salmonella enterica subsp. enterica serovar Richmond]EAA2047611.1 hypothetical protein [Salmonella enterica subsp. enterica serovar Chester]EAB8017846.1 DUF305 domain-containing protein [Salmonella enterica subsp. enterica serovar Newport]EAC1168264.1 DUF305 domain-containing protein [Salmonella enterica subsp. enterica serovar Typhimurium]EAP0132945.1 hypothetical protein [Salmonella enterica]EBH3089248.1 DUF305 domain-containing protein [Salmonella enterica subsp. en